MTGIESPWARPSLPCGSPIARVNVLATIPERKAGFRSLKDTYADTTTPHGRLMLTVLGRLGRV